MRYYWGIMGLLTGLLLAEYIYIPKPPIPKPMFPTNTNCLQMTAWGKVLILREHSRRNQGAK